MKICILILLLLASNAYADSIGDFSDFGANRAYEIFTDTNNFGGILHASNITVQSALDSISYFLTGNIPTNPTDSCNPSLMAYSTSYLYVCVANNTWGRTTLSSWVATNFFLLLENGNYILQEDGTSKIILE